MIERYAITRTLLAISSKRVWGIGCEGWRNISFFHTRIIGVFHSPLELEQLGFDFGFGLATPWLVLKGMEILTSEGMFMKVLRCERGTPLNLRTLPIDSLIFSSFSIFIEIEFFRNGFEYYQVYTFIG